MLNVATLQWIGLPSNYINGNIDEYYYGRGEWLGLSTYENELFDLIKGNTIILKGFDYLDFSNDKYIRGKKDGKVIFYDYTGMKVAEFMDASAMSNGIALVSDGIGLYYVDESFNKISEYIYKEKYNNLGSRVIVIDDKCYLISEQ